MADDFAVDPSEVERFSERLATLAKENARTDEYLTKWLAVDDGVFGDGGLFVIGAKVVRDALATLQPNYAALGRLSESSATELANVARTYRTLDRARAEQLDKAVVPQGQR